jgi:hypothetical protein
VAAMLLRDDLCPSQSSLNNCEKARVPREGRHLPTQSTPKTWAAREGFVEFRQR